VHKSPEEKLAEAKESLLWDGLAWRKREGGRENGVPAQERAEKGGGNGKK